LEIINYPPPVIYDHNIGKSNEYVIIYWKLYVKDYIQGTNLFNVFKYNNTTGVWDMIAKDIKTQSYKDKHVKAFKNYKYKVTASTNYWGTTQNSGESLVKNIYVCAYNRFKNGRYNPKKIINKCYDTKIDTVLHQNVNNIMSKKLIYSFLAKKNGGGVYR
jgi:hypothetical protein